MLFKNYPSVISVEKVLKVSLGKENSMRFFIILISSLILSSCSSLPRIKTHKACEFTTKKPDNEELYPLAIIGAGASGIMATKRAILNNDKVLLFLGAKKQLKNSRGTWVKKIESIPGLEHYDRAIIDMRDETLSSLQHSAFQKNLFIINDSVIDIEKVEQGFVLKDNHGSKYKVEHVILATGMMDEQPLINDSIKEIFPYANNQTIGYCIRCEGHKTPNKEVAVIGFNDDAANAAIILHERYALKKISLLTNGHEPCWNKETQKLIATYGIVVHKQPIKEVIGEKKQGILQGFKLDDATIVQAKRGFVILGMRPNNELAIKLGLDLDPKGLVITDNKCQSSLEHVYVIGDLQSNSMKQVYAAFMHGITAADDINKKIRLKKRRQLSP